MSSRIEVTPKDPTQHVCYVGFDRLQDTYFVYVARPLIQDKGRVVGNANGHTLFWKGTKRNEIETVEELATLIAPYATLAAETYHELRELRLRLTSPSYAGAKD